MTPGLPRHRDNAPADPDLAPPPVRLRMLAGMVERLGSRQDPEQIASAKEMISRQLRRVARELER